jgi:hypothetical protein
MSMSTDLMGLGMPPLLSVRLATGGIGPLTITAAGTTFATAAKVLGGQYVVSCSNASGTNGVSLPTVGTDGGALLADDYIINNATGTQSLLVFSSSGVVLSVGATNTSSTTVAPHTTMTLFPISTTQWIGVKGS